MILSLVVAGLTVSPARAEIYACTGKARVPVYQNFPCQFDRLDADSPSPAAKARTGNVTPGDTDVQPAAAPGPAPAPRVGMRTNDIRAIWGEPLGTSKEEFVKNNVIVWSYADSRSVEFDRRGVVTAIHW